MDRRRFNQYAASAMASAIAWPSANAQSRLPATVRIIVPFTAGGSNDVFARALAQKMPVDSSTQIIVENRPGAGGASGSAFVAGSPGDGGHILIGSNSMVMNAVVQVSPQYDPVKSFKTVSILNRGPNLILVSKNSKYNDLPSLFAAMRSGEVRNYGSAGIGSAAHLFTEMLNRELNSSVQHVPYKGIAPAITDMIGGNIDVVIATPASSSGQLKAGYIKALGVTSAETSPFFPDLMPCTKLLPNFVAESWWGIFASAKTRPELVQYLNQLIQTACKDRYMVDMFTREATTPVNMSTQVAADFVAAETEKWGKVARSRNIRSDT